MKNTTIIAHRGYWKSHDEKNKAIAFKRAFDNGFGIETDLRDVKGNIVISHDMPTGNEMTFEDLLIMLDGRNLPLALNIKADGMAGKIKQMLEKYQVDNYFTFDMSTPEMVYQCRLGLKIFTGLSELVPNPIMLDKAEGVWLDSFYSDWFSEKEILNILNANKKICIVSPELHNREYRTIWKKYKNINRLMICTDYPNKAKEYFSE